MAATRTSTPRGLLSGRLHRRQALRVSAGLLALGLRRRDQAAVREVALVADRLLADELRYVFADARNRFQVPVLHVAEQRTRHRVLGARDVLEGGLHATDGAALDLVHVLFEEAVAEHAERVRIRDELLHDQIVVLARLDVGAVLANRQADRLVLGLVLLLERLQIGIGVAAALDHELVERVAGARRGRRPEHLDLHVRKRRIDILPGLVRVRDQAAARGGNLLREREEQLLERELVTRRLLAVRDHDAVVADLQLGDRVDPVRRALIELGLLDPAGGVGDVRVLHAHAGAEQLHAAAGARALDDRRLELAAAAELLGDRGRERVHGGGAHDPDLVPRPRGRSYEQGGGSA